MQFSSIEDQVTQNTVWAFFLDYNFPSDTLSGKLTKFAGHFRNLPVLSDGPTVFAKTVHKFPHRLNNYPQLVASDFSDILLLFFFSPEIIFFIHFTYQLVYQC